MAVRTDFVAGEVLAAQDLDDTFASKVNYALPVNAQTGSGASAYTFVLADALRLTTASNASAGTYTIPPQSSVTWLANTVIRIVNYGAGVVTIAGGAGVTVTNATKTLAQFESAALIRTAENAWTLVPFSGAGNANFSNAATGTYTDGGIAYKYITFTGSGTLTISTAGIIETLIVGGGGGSGPVRNGGYAHGGGGSCAAAFISASVSAGSYSVVIGAGGVAGLESGDGFTNPYAYGGGGNVSRIGNDLACGGGRGGAGSSGEQGDGASWSGRTARSSSITGTAVDYGLGGTGGGASAGAANTGNGANGPNTPPNGTPNLSGAAGGSGIVIVRVRT